VRGRHQSREDECTDLALPLTGDDDVASQAGKDRECLQAQVSVLTQVPVMSLKFSANRPSRRRRKSPPCRSTKFAASPIRKKPSSSKALLLSSGCRQYPS